MAGFENIIITEDLISHNIIIDRQHAAIVKIINDMRNEIVAPSQHKSDFAELLSRLTDYGLEHFKTEEDYMELYNFPEIKSHRQAHQNYTLRIALLNTNYFQIKSEGKENVLDFLLKWWKEHIQNMDKRYIEYIRERRINY